MKTIKKIIDIFMILVIIVSVILIIIMFNTKKNGISNIFGLIPLSIQTESMEPTIKDGDIILTYEVDTNELKENDIISFFANEQNTKIIKTHRIIQIKNNNGMISYVTKGDNNETIDYIEAAPGDIISVYKGTRIPLLGNILDFLKSQIGFFLFIILPLFIFFIYQLYQFIILIIKEKQRVLEKRGD